MIRSREHDSRWGQPGMVVFLMLLAACFSSTAKAAQKRTPTKLSYTSIQLMPVAPVEPSQRKGKVTLLLESASSAPGKYYKVQLFRKNQLLVINNNFRYSRYLIPFLDKTLFLNARLTVINGMDNVLRLGETVLSFKMDGENVEVDPEDKKEFANAIILPHSNQSFALKIPVKEGVKSCQTFEAAVFEVVTNTDAAGDPSKREFFRWTFKCALQPESVVMDSIVEDVSMTRAEASKQDGSIVQASAVPDSTH